MQKVKNLYTHYEDESNSIVGLANQSVEKEISDNDLATIIKFIQMEAPLSMIKEHYQISSERLVKRLVDYITVHDSYEDPFNTTSLSSEDHYVPSCVGDASGSEDTVQNESAHSVRSDKSCTEVMTCDTDRIKNYKRKYYTTWEKSFFCAYPFPDSIIIKVCRLLDQKVPVKKISAILGITPSLFCRYFSNKEYTGDLAADITAEYLGCYSIYEIISKYKLNCYAVYKVLVTSGVFNCTKTMNHKVFIQSRSYNHYDVGLIEYQLGDRIEFICRRYGISEAVLKAKIEERGIKGVIEN